MYEREGIWNQMVLIKIPALSPNDWMTLSVLLQHSVPQFTHLCGGTGTKDLLSYGSCWDSQAGACSVLCPGSLQRQCEPCGWECFPILTFTCLRGSWGRSVVKNLSASARRCKRCELDPYMGKIPWRRQRSGDHRSSVDTCSLSKC